MFGVYSIFGPRIEFRGLSTVPSPWNVPRGDLELHSTIAFRPIIAYTER